MNKHGLSALYLAMLNIPKNYLQVDPDNRNLKCAEFLLENGALSYMDDSEISKDRSPIFLAIR